MNGQDRQAIEGLFSRLAEAERQAPPKDAEADAYIRQRLQGQPGAPYMMAQTIVVQTHALEQAEQRIQQLEDEAGEPQGRSGSGGMFGGVFGGSGRSAGPVPRSGSVPTAGGPMGAPANGPMMQPQQQGGGFLADAAQTAMGVAGGVLLGNAIGGMFGGGAAQAAPAPATPAPEPQAAAAQPAPAEPAPEPQPVADEGGGGWLDSIFGGGEDV